MPHRKKRSFLSMTLIRRLFRVIRPELPKYLWVCFLGLLMAGLEMIPPRMVGNAINIMSSGPFQFAQLIPLLAAWLGSVVLVQLLFGLQINQASRCGERALNRLRGDVFTHLQRLSMSFYDRVNIGRILSCMGGDINALYSVLTWGLNTVTANAFFLIFAGSLIAITDIKLFLATFWLAPAMSAMNFVYGRRVSEVWGHVRHHAALVSANQAENIDGARVVAAFNRQEENLVRFNELQAISTENNIRVSQKTGFFQPLLQWIRFAGQAIILLYGGYRVVSGDLRAGDLVAVSLYWEWFMMPAQNFGNFFNELIVAGSAAERVFSVLDEHPEVQDRPGAVPLPQLTGHVAFENVSFGYNPERKILKNLSFEVPQGTVVAIVGATGSGKSTIISMISRFYEPQSGKVRFDGHDIGHATLASLKDQVAVVLQNNYLFSGTVMENLRYAKKDATDDEIYAAAKILGAHERILNLPDGYNTQAGDKGGALSLGERQLICFTRALVKNPRILLLDEATSALDPATDQQVQVALRHLVKGRTTFIVTHRLSTAVSSDIVLMLDQGQLAEMGSHRALMANNGPYARLYRSSIEDIKRRHEEPKSDQKSGILTNLLTNPHEARA